MTILEDSNESYPSMVAHYQMLEYSIIMAQIIYSFDIDTSWLMTLLKLIRLDWWLYWSWYVLTDDFIEVIAFKRVADLCEWLLTFFNKMYHRENLGDI